MKVLIIRFSSIGDLLLCTPVIRCVKQQKQAQLTLLTSHKFKGLLASNPYLDEIVTDQAGIMATRQWIIDQHFDLIIDLHKNRKSWLMTLAVGSRVMRFQKLNIAKWWLVQTKQNLLPKEHLVDRYFDSLSQVSVINDGLGLDYFTDTNTRLPVLPHEYNVIVLGAAHKTKRIPKQVAKKWILTSQLPVVIIGGQDVADEGAAIHNEFIEKTVNFAGRLTLDESAVVLSHARHIVTGDTGMMHLAAALKKEVIVLWGNTTPVFGMYPYYGNLGIKWHSKEVQGLSCRPCSKLGYDACPKGHFHCMLLQKEEVW